MGFLPQCVFCGEEVDPRRAGTYYKAKGWIENRGSVGGGNAIELKEMLGEYAHKICIAEKKVTHTEVQESLF